MIHVFDRPLSSAERQTTESRLARLRRRERSALWRAATASSGVCAVFAALTLLASDAPVAVVVAFWVAVAGLLAVLVGLPERNRLGRRAASLAAALEANRARGTRIQSARVVEFEETEDEGACYAFAVDATSVVFVRGQEFYASATFPNSDFSLVEILAPDGAIVDEIMTVDGTVLIPERRISSETNARLILPDHLQVVAASMEHLEAQLPARPM